MLCWRRISAIGTPASPCFRISTIWLSVNRDFRMGISLAPESLRSKCLLKGEAYGRSNLELRSEGDPYPRPRSQPAAPGFPWQALKCRGPGSQTRSCAGMRWSVPELGTNLGTNSTEGGFRSRQLAGNNGGQGRD